MHIQQELSSSSAEESKDQPSTTVELHPLNNKWTIWTHLSTNPKWDAASYLKLYEMSTMEDTIAICDTIVEPFITKSMFYIMKSGILPRWEEPQNISGGCFSYTISNKNAYDVWKKLTYALVGESISTNEQFVQSINGITISPKKNFCVLKIWMNSRTFQDQSLVSVTIKGLSKQGCIFKHHGI